MSDGVTGDRQDEDFSREAFMAAIIKLADDAAFRESFLRHYQLWLYPPMMVTPPLPEDFDLTPGAINFVTEEELAEMRRASFLPPGKVLEPFGEWFGTGAWIKDAPEAPEAA